MCVQVMKEYESHGGYAGQREFSGTDMDATVIISSLSLSLIYKHSHVQTVIIYT